jgi:DNA-binding NarL/FixJ family response regulator
LAKLVNVFVVADQRLLREALCSLVHKRNNSRVVGTAPYSVETLGQVSDSGCDVLLVDWGTLRLAGTKFIRDVVERAPCARVVVVGMEAAEEVFLECVCAGAVGYVLKDASVAEIATAVQAVARGEAVCPPRLCLYVFNYLARQSEAWYDFQAKTDFGMSRRERELIPLIVRGLTNKEIASQLNLSEQTVKNHIRRMLRKVGGADRSSIADRFRSLLPSPS